MGLLTGTRRALIGGRRSYYDKVLSYGPIAYWPLWERAGTTAQCLVNTAQNGAHTGVTLANAPGPDGNPCPFFDGANDYVHIYSAALVSAMNVAEGSVCIWGKVFNAATWAGVVYKAVCNLGRDGNNYINIFKWNAANTLSWRYKAAGTEEQRLKAGVTSLDWMHLALTWSKTADEVRAYYNGVQEGATMTVLGNFVTPLITNYMTIGANSNLPDYVWHGWLAHCAVFNRALTPAQIADLAVV